MYARVAKYESKYLNEAEVHEITTDNPHGLVRAVFRNGGVDIKIICEFDSISIEVGGPGVYDGQFATITRKREKVNIMCNEQMVNQLMHVGRGDFVWDNFNIEKAVKAESLIEDFHNFNSCYGGRVE
jgi:hypothetical protein